MHRANILKDPKAAFYFYGARFAINPFVEGDQMRARPSLLVVLIYLRTYIADFRKILSDLAL